MTTSTGFKTTGNKGFHITFANGWTISVQFGGGNYCDNYNFPFGEERQQYSMESSTAEVAYFNQNGVMESFGNGDQVEGRQTPTQVLELMNMVAAKGKHNDYKAIQ